MAVSIPSKPPTFEGNPKDEDYAAQLQEHQEKMMIWQMTVQAAQHEMTQEQETASALEKTKHDALMAIIRNISN
jgi:hypothetical protein